jgi:hypothetical protein
MIGRLEMGAFILSCVLCMAGYSCDREAHHLENTTAKKDAYHFCSADSDCTAVKTSCCGCNQGGRQEAVSVKVANDLNAKWKAACAKTICPQVVSNDPSCNKSPRCESDQCLLR